MHYDENQPLRHLLVSIKETENFRNRAKKEYVTKFEALFRKYKAANISEVDVIDVIKAQALAVFEQDVYEFSTPNTAAYAASSRGVGFGSAPSTEAMEHKQALNDTLKTIMTEFREEYMGLEDRIIAGRLLECIKAAATTEYVNLQKWNFVVKADSQSQGLQ